MKILNAYAGIGGNRKLWGNDHDITAVEINPKIADIYKKYFPDDIIIIADAHQYILDHYNEFDFIWASPPCPSHSDIRRCGVHKGQFKAVYPEMSLYQEIILLKHFASKKCKWVVENVKPYYDPLIYPSYKFGRHYFWNNFNINTKKFVYNKKPHDRILSTDTIYGFNLDQYKIKDKVKILRNLVNPEIGQHFLKRVEEIHSGKKVQQIGLFKDL